MGSSGGDRIDRSENVNDVKQTLKIPEEIAIVCLVMIGVPNEKPRARPRDVQQEICFNEIYGKLLDFH